MQIVSNEEERFKNELNQNAGQIDWKLLISLWPCVRNPNSTSFSRNDALEPTILFLLAERTDNSQECLQFIDLVLNDPRIDFTVLSPMFKNTAFLWAISRYHEPLPPSDQPKDHDFYHLNISDLYRGIHSSPLFVEKLFKKMSEDSTLQPLLRQQSAAENVCNTPLLMAVKNHSLNFAKQLLPYYDLESLLVKTIAGNTVLHLLAFFRRNDLIKVIIDHVRVQGGEEGVTQLLCVKNGNGKTPAQCYQAEVLPINDFKDRCLAADTFIVGGIRLPRNCWNPTEENWNNLANFIMESAFVRLCGGQEGAHRYSTVRRNEKSEEILDLLQARDVDAPYTNLDTLLDQIFISDKKQIREEQPKHKAPERKITFSFANNNRSIKDPELRKKLMYSLAKEYGFSGKVTHIAIYEFYHTNERDGKPLATCYINPKLGRNVTPIFSLSTDYELTAQFEPTGELSTQELDRYNALPKIEITESEYRHWLDERDLELLFDSSGDEDEEEFDEEDEELEEQPQHAHSTETPDLSLSLRSNVTVGQPQNNKADDDLALDLNQLYTELKDNLKHYSDEDELTQQSDLKKVGSYISLALSPNNYKTQQQKIIQEFNQVIEKYCRDARPWIQNIGVAIFILGMTALLIGFALLSAASVLSIASVFMLHVSVPTATLAMAGTATALSGATGFIIGIELTLFGQSSKAGSLLQKIESQSPVFTDPLTC